VASAALPRRLIWQPARLIEAVREAERAKSLVFDLSAWPGQLAGQHVDVRLTADDGYQAQRSYSIASSPEDDRLVLTVERLADGEVSPYLVDELVRGDEIELRGPIGGHFVWEQSLGGPVLLVAGGSGIVPLRAMLRHRRATGSTTRMRLLYSARSLPDVIYRDEFIRLQDDEALEAHLTLTRDWPHDWRGHRGRVDRRLLERIAWAPDQRPLIYICGPTGFVEGVADGLVDSGHLPERIRTERFGATGT
jgi:ferredoxin-NADP reductase